MSEVSLLLEATSIRVRLAIRVAASAATLFVVLFLCRTALDSVTPRRISDTNPLQTHHLPLFVIYAPVLWLYLALCNTVFRSTNRRTAWQLMSSSQQTVALITCIYAPVFASVAIATYGSVLSVGVVSAIASLPALLWVTLCPGVAAVLRKQDRDVEAEIKKRRRTEPIRIESQIDRLRQACLRRKRQIQSLPIDEEEREMLIELTENALRDQIHDLIATSNHDSFDFTQLFQNPQREQRHEH